MNRAIEMYASHMSGTSIHSATDSLMGSSPSAIP
jgi:hypothetical protein